MSREYEDEGMKVREKPVETKVIRDDEVKEAPLEVEESVQKTAARTETIRHPLTDQEYGDTMREEIEQVLGPVMDTFKDIKPGEIRADYAVAGIRTYQDFKQFGVSDELLRRIGIVSVLAAVFCTDSSTSKGASFTSSSLITFVSTGFSRTFIPSSSYSLLI